MKSSRGQLAAFARHGEALGAAHRLSAMAASIRFRRDRAGSPHEQREAGRATILTAACVTGGWRFTAGRIARVSAIIDAPLFVEEASRRVEQQQSRLAAKARAKRQPARDAERECPGNCSPYRPAHLVKAAVLLKRTPVSASDFARHRARAVGSVLEHNAIGSAPLISPSKRVDQSCDAASQGGFHAGRAENARIFAFPSSKTEVARILRLGPWSST